VKTALAVSPHPDDELIPVGGTLTVLADAGWRIVNLACSLGRAEQHERRRAELTAACAAAGFELDIPAVPVPLSGAEPGDGALAVTEELVRDRLAAYQPSLVLAPGPRDKHPAHELVAQAVASAVAGDGTDRTVWWWELWGYLDAPTLLVRVDHVIDRVCAALEAHSGEIARNDFVGLVRSRARVASILGPERVFGFGASGVDYAAAEVLSETVFRGGKWRSGEPRELDVRQPTIAGGA
jgi:LmbE family N-acetylglucosaminyl deacetylase